MWPRILLYLSQPAATVLCSQTHPVTWIGGSSICVSSRVLWEGPSWIPEAKERLDEGSSIHQCSCEL